MEVKYWAGRFCLLSPNRKLHDRLVGQVRAFQTVSTAIITSRTHCLCVRACVCLSRTREWSHLEFVSAQITAPLLTT